MAKEERKIRLALSVLLSSCLWAGVSAEEPVYFPDPNLQKAVEIRLFLPEPTPTDMLGLTMLGSPMSGIADLTGLEYATNLRMLVLRSNRIRDVSPLSGLTHLRELWVNVNLISDISPLAGLTELDTLLLHDNWIRDLSPLSDLSNLEYLDFRNNEVNDLSPLAGMPKLDFVDAFNNHIHDLAPLLDLTHLRRLDLRENPLNDQAYLNHLQVIMDHNPEIELSYSPNTRGPAGVMASAGTLPDQVHLTWEAVCRGPQHTSYYQVSRSLSAGGAKAPLSGWQSSLSFDDATAEPGIIYCYRVQTGDAAGGGTRGDYSEPAVGWVRGPSLLTVSSGHGGVVTVPGAGEHAAPAGQTVALRAEPMDANLYSFAEWTGTAVEAGLVADARSASTTLTMPAARCTLVANFLSRMNTIHVDDDAPNDPGPGNGAVGDPWEDGTRAHPFDTIQEGINVAPEGAIIVVRPGTYHECVAFRGRNIRVTGLDPNGVSLPKAFPVIDANYAGTAVTFAQGEGMNCVLAGFVITRGDGPDAGGICCLGSSPTITHCLIVGNRASNMGRAAVCCRGSHATFSNCTIDNKGAGMCVSGIYLDDSRMALADSIVWCDAPPSKIVENWRVDGSKPSMSYTCMPAAGPGSGNLDVDPLFVRPGRWVNPKDPNAVVGPWAHPAIWVEGDYHLKSQAGRWDPQAQAWAQDDVTSRCIDAGDPNSPVGDEPEPNGGRVNMGAYGGTAEASKSP